MSKVRWSALGLAVMSVVLLATPASAARVVTKFNGKGATAIVTDCPANASPGTRCIAFVAVASQVRIREDGTVTKLPSLSLEKYRVKIIQGGFETVFLFGGFTDVVKLQVADDLSHATASGTVPIEQCDQQGCHITNFPVSFELKATAPADFNRGRVVQKFGNCKIIDRFNFRTRTADGSATVRGKTYPTTPAVPSSIDRSTEKVVFRNCDA